MYVKKILAAFAVLALTGALAACGGSSGSGSSPTTASGNEGPSEEISDDAGGGPGTVGTAPDGFELSPDIEERVKTGEPKIVLSYGYPTVPFGAELKKGMEAEGEELGADVSMIGPGGGKPEEQIAELQTLITQGEVDAIGIAPLSADTMKPVISQAVAAGIPVVSFNITNEGSEQLAFIGAELVHGGVIAGERMAEELKGTKGKIVAFSIDSSGGWSQERVEGIKQGLEGSGLEIVGGEAVNTGTDPNQAYGTIQNTMKGDPEAVGVMSMDDVTVNLAAKWSADEGGDIPVSGYDTEKETLEAIKAGTVKFTISQHPQVEAAETVKLLYDYLKKGGTIEDIETPQSVITEANMAEVEKEALG